MVHMDKEMLEELEVLVEAHLKMEALLEPLAQQAKEALAEEVIAEAERIQEEAAAAEENLQLDY